MEIENNLAPVVNLLKLSAEETAAIEIYKMTVKQIQELFKYADITRKGYLDLKDVYQLAKHLTQNQLFNLFKKLDVSKNGNITLTDMLQNLSSQQIHASTTDKLSILARFHQFVEAFNKKQIKIHQFKMNNRLSADKLSQIYEHLCRIIKSDTFLLKDFSCILGIESKRNNIKWSIEEEKELKELFYSQGINESKFIEAFIYNQEEVGQQNSDYKLNRIQMINNKSEEGVINKFQQGLKIGYRTFLTDKTQQRMYNQSKMGNEKRMDNEWRNKHYEQQQKPTKIYQKSYLSRKNAKQYSFQQKKMDISESHNAKRWDELRMQLSQTYKGNNFQGKNQQFTLKPMERKQWENESEQCDKKSIDLRREELRRDSIERKKLIEDVMERKKQLSGLTYLNKLQDLQQKLLSYNKGTRTNKFSNTSTNLKKSVFNANKTMHLNDRKVNNFVQDEREGNYYGRNDQRGNQYQRWYQTDIKHAKVGESISKTSTPFTHTTKNNYKGSFVNDVNFSGQSAAIDVEAIIKKYTINGKTQHYDHGSLPLTTQYTAQNGQFNGFYSRLNNTKEQCVNQNQYCENDKYSNRFVHSVSVSNLANQRCISKQNIMRRAENEAVRKIEDIERRARLKMMQKKGLNKWLK